MAYCQHPNPHSAQDLIRHAETDGHSPSAVPESDALLLYAAQGNFPYESPYILNGLGLLPAYPVRVACESLAEDGLRGRALLAGLAQASAVFYNYSGQLDCLDYRQANLFHGHFTKACART